MSIAQSLSGHSAKASMHVQERIALGKPQDLIVVFDEKAIQKDTESLQATTRFPSNHKSIIDYKSKRFSEQKLNVLSTVASGETIVLRQYSHLPMSFIRVHSKRALDKLLASPNVVAAYEDGVLHRAYMAQSLPLIGQPQAAAAGDIGSGTYVAVLDQRVDYSQPIFGSCTSPGVPSGCKVVVAQDSPGMPNDGLGFQDNHGTNVAGTVLSVAPGTKIISLNVFNGESANDTDIIKAIDWCIDSVRAGTYNIVAINLSLGDHSSNANPLTTASAQYYSAFANARAAKILPVVAAGNDAHISGISLPAAVVGAVSVGAVYDAIFGEFTAPTSPKTTCTDSSTAPDLVTCFSNSASFLTLLAPGCRTDGGIQTPPYMCGTSQATPHVAGAVAVLRSTFPSETLDQTVARLTNGVQVTDTRGNGITKPRLSLPMALSLPPCSYSASPANVSVTASGTTSSNISVSTGAGCSWSATTNSNWITFLSGTSASGSGTVQYSIDFNNSSTSRSGSISVAGQSVTVTQAAGGGSLSSQSNVWLVGNDSYSISGLGTVTLSVDQIFNSSFTNTTGTLRLELWLTTAPFSVGMSGWRVASNQLSITGSPMGTLPPRQSFINLIATQPLVNWPPPGSYYVSLQVAEYQSLGCQTNSWCLDTYVKFKDQLFIPDVTAPTVPTALSAAVTGPTSVVLKWNASTDDVAVTAYRVYNNGILLGRITTLGASVTSLSPSTTYRFSVSACDAAENCSAQSWGASATTTAISIALTPGWNLVGNGVEAPITVANTFNNANKVTSVWKWIPSSTKWAFYTPTQTDGGAAYAASKGYNILTTINAGEGFWVNASVAFSVPLPSGTAVQSSNFKPATTSPAAAGGTHALPSGWSLIATGDSFTPAQFDAAIVTALATPPAAGKVYTNLTTLWAWDATKQSWYFWAPALFNSGSLSSYISSKNYLDSATMPSTPIGTLSPTTGFWVNMP